MTKATEQDWSMLEATQASLREHMAEIQRLRAALAEQQEHATMAMLDAARVRPISAEARLAYCDGWVDAELHHGIGGKR